MENIIGIFKKKKIEKDFKSVEKLNEFIVEMYIILLNKVTWSNRKNKIYDKVDFPKVGDPISWQVIAFFCQTAIFDKV